ncbi:MAG: recombinase family protein [Kocuria sp.]|nr:recombinase family protein [Kocuria sp.]
MRPRQLRSGARYGYTRTSTWDKRTGALQRRALIGAGVPEDQIWSDQVSAGKAASSRPGWSALEARLRKGDELVVWRIDRVGRSLVDVVMTVTDLIDRGVLVRSVSDGLDPSTPKGRLMLRIMSTLADCERELTRERVQTGLDAAKARGVRFGRPEVDPDEMARRVRTVEHLVGTEGMTVTQAVRMVAWSRASYYRYRASGREDP